MGARLDGRELAEWMAYYRLEPFGEERADWRMAILATTIANAPYKRPAGGFKPEAFMPFVEKPRQSIEDMRRTARAGIAAAKAAQAAQKRRG